MSWKVRDVLTVASYVIMKKYIQFLKCRRLCSFLPSVPSRESVAGIALAWKTEFCGEVVFAGEILGEMKKNK
jgi:hypothetical protein